MASSDENAKKLEEQLNKLGDKVETRLEKIAAHLGSIDVTLARNTISLEEHIRRTNAIEKKLEPVEKHVSMVAGAIKLIILLGTIVGAYVGFKK